MSRQELYFVAIVPPEPVLSEVWSMKEEVRDLFGSKHGLKSPAHITLFPPFKAGELLLEEISNQLAEIAAQSAAFVQPLDGFACFPPRVIFVKPDLVPELEDIYHLVSETLLPITDTRHDPGRPFHPHMTIAHRDLKREVFPEAWEHYRQREYRRRFPVRDISLMRHEGGRWVQFRIFELSDV